MRGIALPINVVVVIAIAVVVLLAGLAFFMGGFTPAATSMGDVEAWNRGCGIWKLSGCIKESTKYDIDNVSITGYDPDGDGEWNSILDACRRVYGSDKDQEDCWQYCCNFSYPG